MFIWKKVKPPARNTVIDIREVEFDFLMSEGSEIQLSNPLGTEFDLADIFLEGDNEGLDVSPFLYVWDDNLAAVYNSKKGIWLSCTSDQLFLTFGTGGQPDQIDESEQHCFFSVPEGLHSTQQTLRLMLSCTN